MIAQRRPDVAQVRRWLEDVPDPEVPVVSVVDLGIVRDVIWSESDEASDLRSASGVPGESATLIVTITPTYSGCPATRVIERDIVRALRERGVERVRLDVRVSPPWTTDWLSEAGRENLRAYGIAPPERGASSLLDITSFTAPMVSCPRCASPDTELTSRFGSTPCKALYRCNACREPFDHFKCH